MSKWKIYFTWMLLATTVPGNVFSLICSRYPQNTLTPKAPVDDNFAISITGNAQTYLLGQSYNGKWVVNQCSKTIISKLDGRLDV